MKRGQKLDSIHHVAIIVDDIDRAIRWYQSHLHTALVYADDTWAMLAFENISLALVKAEQHPPHFAVENEKADQYGPLTRHRDGTESLYIKDSEGNSIELLRRQVKQP
jgi:catechol 2,3-dioxygenase-like lactoylglutathione lyase family enzyme